MAEFQWWLLLLGLVAGGGIVAVVYMDGARRDQDIDDDELPAEASWISESLAARGRSVDATTVMGVLIAHRAYRVQPPPDRIEAVGGSSIEPPSKVAAGPSTEALVDARADTPDVATPGPTA